LQTQGSLNIFNWKNNKLLHRFDLQDLESYRKYKYGFIVHPSISENGQKILFMHRIPIGKIVYSYLYYVDLNTKIIKLLTEEKVTHFTWINNDKFLIYQRLLPKFIKSKRIKRKNLETINISKSKILKSRLKKNFIFIKPLKDFLGKISSGFVLYEVRNKEIQKRLISLNLLGIDCHPFYSRKHKKIFLDSYPNKKKNVEIYSINLKNPLFAKKERVLKGEWKTHLGKLDAHIRVSGNGNYISIDDIFKKMRSIRIFKFHN
jgi:hypothetical protein